MLSKNSLDGCWPQSMPLTAQQLFENSWSQLAWGFDLLGFYLMRMVTDSEPQNSSPVQNRHILPEVLIIQNYFRLPVFSIKLRSEICQVKYHNKKNKKPPHIWKLILAIHFNAFSFACEHFWGEKCRSRPCSLKMYLLKCCSFTFIMVNFEKSLIIL